MTTRRTVILGVTAVLCANVVSAHAQRERLRRVGVLAASPPPPDLASVTSLEALERGLRDHGWKPGIDIVLEIRYASGNVERMREQAAELARIPVDVIVARGTEATRIAREQAGAIPIVMSFVADPVGAGFVRSLARPGGSITGLSFLVQTLQGKQLEYLKEISPGLARVAVLGNSTSFPRSQYQSFVKAVEMAAAGLRLSHQIFDARDAKEMRAVFTEIGAARFDGLLLFTDPFLLEPHRADVVDFAAKHRLPAIFPWSHYVDGGGLMSYSASQSDLHRRAAGFVDKILKGIKPADLPVEQPLKFEFVINLKTATALGLTVPQTLLLRADRVVE